MSYDSLVPTGSLKLLIGPNFLKPESDISIAPRLLKYTVANSAGAFARIYRPKRTLALSNLDRAHRNFPQILALAQETGFSPVVRSPGGRAVAYHEESVIFDLVCSEKNPRESVSKRFSAIGEIFVQVLGELGIDSKVGQIPMEYCPGKYSVTTDSAKLVGTAQRIVRGGWLLSSSIIVRNCLPIRELLSRVYGLMEFQMNPATIEALNETDSHIKTERFIDEFIAKLRGQFEIEDCELTASGSFKVREVVSDQWVR